jgi:bacillithiol system protein YtxJ
MNWLNITSDRQLEEIREKSKVKPQVIFKHSIRCAVSSMVKTRLEKSNPPANIDFNFLDLINNRSLSNKLAEEFDVWHESPQVLLIKDGKCVYNESHSAIRMADLVEQMQQL